MNWKERNYIRWRRLKAFGGSLCFYLCRLFPVDGRLVAVCTFEGKGGFGCNPKYIVKELHRRDSGLRFVWFVNDMTKEFPPYIRKVPNTALSRAWWLSRSKVWIDNYRKPLGTVKRRRQVYVNTWHGTIGFKATGLWRGNGFSKIAYLVSKNDSAMVDRFLIDSAWCEQMCPKGFVYDGQFLKSGAPRCDVLYGDRAEYRQKFRVKHGIPENARLVMFAPTYRESAKSGKRSVFSELWTIDFKRLLDNLARRFGGSWYLCIRVHPQIASLVQVAADKLPAGRCIDASHEDDMYETLAGMDAYITDYSCAAMEAGFCHIPVFIYADDIEAYAKGRGNLLWNLSENTDVPVGNNKLMTPGIDAVLPYPIAKDNDELERRIRGFDEHSYAEKLGQFEKAVGLLFDGKASSRVADYILERL